MACFRLQFALHILSTTQGTLQQLARNVAVLNEAWPCYEQALPTGFRPRWNRDCKFVDVISTPSGG